MLLVTTLASPVWGDGPVIAPFSHTYNFSGAGIPFSIKAERSLRNLPGTDVWEMQIHARNMLGEIRETTRFSWRGCLPISEHYGYYRRGLGRVREASLALDHASGQAVLHRDGVRARDFAITADTTDILSQTLALQCLLESGQVGDGPITFDVANERRLEPMSYVVTGKESLRTPAGRFQTLRLERLRDDDSGRRTLLWFAPELGHTLVKMIQDDAGDSYELVLRSR